MTAEFCLAVANLYSSQASAQQKRDANNWLVWAQSQFFTWNVCCDIISQPSLYESQPVCCFIAAKMLASKVKKDWGQCSAELHAQVSSSLLCGLRSCLPPSLSSEHKPTWLATLNQLCHALASISLTTEEALPRLVMDVAQVQAPQALTRTLTCMADAAKAGASYLTEDALCRLIQELRGHVAVHVKGELIDMGAGLPSRASGGSKATCRVTYECIKSWAECEAAMPAGETWLRLEDLIGSGVLPLLLLTWCQSAADGAAAGDIAVATEALLSLTSHPCSTSSEAELPYKQGVITICEAIASVPSLHGHARNSTASPDGSARHSTAALVTEMCSEMMERHSHLLWGVNEGSLPRKMLQLLLEGTAHHDVYGVVGPSLEFWYYGCQYMPPTLQNQVAPALASILLSRSGETAWQLQQLLRIAHVDSEQVETLQYLQREVMDCLRGLCSEWGSLTLVLSQIKDLLAACSVTSSDRDGRELMGCICVVAECSFGESNDGDLADLEARQMEDWGMILEWAITCGSGQSEASQSVCQLLGELKPLILAAPHDQQMASMKFLLAALVKASSGATAGAVINDLAQHIPPGGNDGDDLRDLEMMLPFLASAAASGEVTESALSSIAAVLATYALRLKAGARALCQQSLLSLLASRSRQCFHHPRYPQLASTVGNSSNSHLAQLKLGCSLVQAALRSIAVTAEASLLGSDGSSGRAAEATALVGVVLLTLFGSISLLHSTLLPWMQSASDSDGPHAAFYIASMLTEAVEAGGGNSELSQAAGDLALKAFVALCNSTGADANTDNMACLTRLLDLMRAAMSDASVELQDLLLKTQLLALLTTGDSELIAHVYGHLRQYVLSLDRCPRAMLQQQLLSSEEAHSQGCLAMCFMDLCITRLEAVRAASVNRQMLYEEQAEVNALLKFICAAADACTEAPESEGHGSSYLLQQLLSWPKAAEMVSSLLLLNGAWKDGNGRHGTSWVYLDTLYHLCQGRTVPHALARHFMAIVQVRDGGEKVEGLRY
ncbi:unnamed protein product [Chrysoparadoxa australica]